MLPGSNLPPYRAPCAGSVLCGNGPRYQHWKASEQNIEVWLYNALVPDYATEGNYIAPYERPTPGGGSCYSTDTCPDPTSDYPPCVPWIGTMDCQYLQTADASHPVPVSWAADGTVNLATCHKYGYKNVQARRQWHGAPGFFWNGGQGFYSCTTTDETSGLDVNCFTAFTPYSNSAPQIKYKTCAVSCTYTESDYIDNDGTVAQTYNDSYSGSLSVDPLTGLLAGSGAATGNEWDTNAAVAWLKNITITNATDWFNQPACALYGEDNVGCPDSQYWASAPPFLCDQIDNYETESGDLVYYKSYEITDNSWSTYSPVQDDEGHFIGTQEECSGSWSIDGSSASFSYTNVDETLGTLTISATITDSQFDYSYSYQPYYGIYGFPPYPPEGSTYSQQFTCTLTFSNTNTADNVQADIAGLLDYWDLSDDSLYPWRTDEYTSIAPLVTRNEVPDNIQPNFAPLDGDYTDENAGQYDSTILGKPMPAGYQGFFDFAFQVYDDGTIVGQGQTNTGQYGIPLNATQWTNPHDAVQYPPGAWIFYNHNPSWENCSGGEAGYAYPPNEVCIAQKWAETKMPWASQNFFRPAGDDRFIYDENQVYSISATSGSGEGAQITLEHCDSCASVTLSDTSGLWGGPAVGGFYEISSVSGSTVTLGALIYNVPSDWQSASSDNSYCFGKLRWSTGDAATDPPAILGRAGVSAVAEYDGNPDVTELTTDSLPTLGMIVSGHDSVDIYDSGMNLLAGNVAVTRIDDTHFTVPVAASTLANAAWLMSHGAPAYYWNDQYPKGDFVYTDWTWWPRVICEASRINTINTSCTGGDGCSDCPDAETQYQYPFSAFNQEAGCVPFSPCNPSVLCISPNGETFGAGATYGFPSISFDEQYGSGWQAEFQQVMVDLLYQSPHYPAQGGGCTSYPWDWQHDNGSCENDSGTNRYYALSLVEARLTVPAGAPALPSGIQIGWDSPVDVLSGTASPEDFADPPFDGNVLYPPGSNGDGLTQDTAWGTWEAMCDCVTGGGRFADEYENIALNCS